MHAIAPQACSFRIGRPLGRCPERLSLGCRKYLMVSKREVLDPHHSLSQAPKCSHAIKATPRLATAGCFPKIDVNEPIHKVVNHYE